MNMNAAMRIARVVDIEPYQKVEPRTNTSAGIPKTEAAERKLAIIDIDTGSQFSCLFAVRNCRFEFPRRSCQAKYTPIPADSRRKEMSTT